MKNTSILLGIMGVCSVLAGCAMVVVNVNYSVAVTMMSYGCFMFLIHTAMNEKLMEQKQVEKFRNMFK